MAMPADKRIVRIAQLTTFEDGTPMLAITEAYSYRDEQDQLALKRKRGGIWVNVSPDRPDHEIVRDLKDVRQACAAFMGLADDEIAKREQPTQPAMKAARKSK